MSEDVIWRAPCNHYRLCKRRRDSGALCYELIERSSKCGSVYATRREALKAAEVRCRQRRCEHAMPALSWEKKSRYEYAAGEYLVAAIVRKVAGERADTIWSLHRDGKFCGYYETSRDACTRAEKVAHLKMAKGVA